jgi:hypothetical protein
MKLYHLSCTGKKFSVVPDSCNGHKTKSIVENFVMSKILINLCDGPFGPFFLLIIEVKSQALIVCVDSHCFDVGTSCWDDHVVICRHLSHVGTSDHVFVEITVDCIESQYSR